MFSSIKQKVKHKIKKYIIEEEEKALSFQKSVICVAN